MGNKLDTAVCMDYWPFRTDLHEGSLLSGKTLDCRPKDCEFNLDNPPSQQLKLLKGDTCVYRFLPGKMPHVSVLYTGLFKEPQVCHVVGALVSCPVGH